MMITTVKALQYHSPKDHSCDRKRPSQTPKSNVRAIRAINKIIATIDNVVKVMSCIFLYF